jgi:hypothetical protein
VRAAAASQPFLQLRPNSKGSICAPFFPRVFEGLFFEGGSASSGSLAGGKTTLSSGSGSAFHASAPSTGNTAAGDPAKSDDDDGDMTDDGGGQTDAKDHKGKARKKKTRTVFSRSQVRIWAHLFIQLIK